MASDMGTQLITKSAKNNLPKFILTAVYKVVFDNFDKNSRGELIYNYISSVFFFMRKLK